VPPGSGCLEKLLFISAGQSGITLGS